MAETGIAGEGNILHRMALSAIRGDSESFFAVMTGAARFAFLHIGHRRMNLRAACREDLAVALVALEERLVNIVAEICLAGVRNDKLYFTRRLVTLVTASVRGEGGFPVMTGAAGLRLFHIRHGIPLAVRTADEE